MDVRARAYDFNVRLLSLRVLPSQRFVRFLFSRTSRCQPRRLVGIYNPRAVICPYSTGYLLLGLIIICFKVCGWMLLRFLRLLRSDTFSHFGESIQFLGGLSSLSKHARGFNVQSLRRAAMSTTPSGRYNTIPRVVALIYRIFLTWIGFLGFRDGVVEIYSFAFPCTLSISMVLSVYMYRIDFLLES